MNLSELNSVQELLAANQLPADCDSPLVDKVLDLLDNDEEVTPQQVLNLAMNLVAQVGAHHDRVVKHLEDDTEAVDVRDVWVVDEAKLHVAWNLLNEVYSAE